MSAKRTAKKLKRLKPNEAFPIIRIAGFEITFADLLTALNLVAGVAAIFSAFKGETLISLILIVGGIFFDYFDGKIARAYALAHDFGRELDSLADIVTFGVAPGVLLLALFPGSDLILTAAAFYGVAAAFRLARFNLIKEAGLEEEGYRGLPVPAAAALLLVFSLPFFFPIITFLILPAWGMALVTLACILLMLSSIKFPKI
jgi:CDP-diacylglycerol--serine O-phosphatidyltransferase